MKMSEFLTEPQDLPTIEAVDTIDYLVLQTSYCIKQLHNDYDVVFAMMCQDASSSGNAGLNMVTERFTVSFIVPTLLILFL